MAKAAPETTSKSVSTKYVSAGSVPANSPPMVSLPGTSSSVTSTVSVPSTYQAAEAVIVTVSEPSITGSFTTSIVKVADVPPAPI